MDIRKLQSTIIGVLEDVKAQNILAFDTRHLTNLFDRIILASGTSNRQTRSLAMSIREKVKNLGGEIITIEGLETGEWVLVDCNEIVVHIMQPIIRDYYKLEQLWGDKPIHITSQKANQSDDASEKLATKKRSLK